MRNRHSSATKFFVILAILVILTGAGLGIYGMYKLNWDVKQLSPFEKGETIVKTISADSVANLNKITIESLPRDIKFIKSDTDEIKLKYDTVKLKTSDQTKSEVSYGFDDDSTLNIREYNSYYIEGKNKYMFDSFYETLSVEIHVPNDIKLGYRFNTIFRNITFDSIDINDLTIGTCYGDITLLNSTIYGAIDTAGQDYVDDIILDKCNILQDLDIKTQSSDLSMKDTTINGALTFKTISGDFICNNVTANKANIKISSGDVSLENVTLTSTLDISIISGDVDATQLKAENVSLVGTSSDVNLNNIDINGTLRVETVSGEINVKSNLNKATFITVSGDINVIVYGKRDDYTLDKNSHITNAGKDKYIKVTTTSGDISLEFNN